MLSRLEGVYLSILRVVILIVATLALIATSVGLVSLVPLVGTFLGLDRNSQVKSVDLGDYIRENKLEGTPSASSDFDVGKASKSVPSDISVATTIITSYVNKIPGVRADKASVEGVLVEKYESEGVMHQEEYASSLLNLSRQLEQSHGKMLTLERVNELLNWHKNQFDNNVTINEAKKNSEKATAMIGVSAAGYAFLVFIAIVFCFIFVKIERNLRSLTSLNENNRIVS